VDHRDPRELQGLQDFQDIRGFKANKGMLVLQGLKAREGTEDLLDHKEMLGSLGQGDPRVPWVRQGTQEHLVNRGTLEVEDREDQGEQQESQEVLDPRVCQGWRVSQAPPALLAPQDHPATR